MNVEQIRKFARIEHRVTTRPVKIIHYDGTYEVGFFTPEDEDFNADNKWRIVTNNNFREYSKEFSKDYTNIIDGDEISEIILL